MSLLYSRLAELVAQPEAEYEKQYQIINTKFNAKTPLDLHSLLFDHLGAAETSSTQTLTDYHPRKLIRRTLALGNSCVLIHPADREQH